MDAATGNAIEFADVVVTDNENNTVASTTVKEGSFTIDRVREGEFVVTVMLVGYQPFVSEPIAFGAGKSTDLGTISLSMNETGLEEVVVTGERSRLYINSTASVSVAHRRSPHRVVRPLMC